MTLTDPPVVKAYRAFTPLPRGLSYSLPKGHRIFLLWSGVRAIPLRRRGAGGGSEIIRLRFKDSVRKRIIAYEPHLKDLARELRHHSTLAEILLWRQLKGKRMLGYDFDRQKPIDQFIVDFFCAKLKLAIEIDGESHWQIGEEDRNRQSRLEGLGICFLRFPDIMVKRDMHNVLSSIQAWIEKHQDKSASRSSSSNSTHP